MSILNPFCIENHGYDHHRWILSQTEEISNHLQFHVFFYTGPSFNLSFKISRQVDDRNEQQI